MTAAAPPVRIAMWSGPRNISTAMMRSWAARADCAAIDEPLYGAYLATTGIDHPGREEILAATETDWRRVIAALTGAVPGDKAIYYQKHMAHHLTPDVGREWILGLSNAFLIRHPKAMVASYARKRQTVAAAELGLTQQVELFDRIADRTGLPPPVIDAAGVLADPAGMLAKLCVALGVPFDPAMMHWNAGPQPEDGIWGKYWYDAVWRSTGFTAPARQVEITLPAGLERVVEACMPLYDKLSQARIA